MRPHIVHIVHRFDFGGMENGLVNLVNRMPSAAARHTILALTEATEFSQRIDRPDVEVIAIHKQPGKDPTAYVRLFKILRRLKPTIVHTRNFGTLDCQLFAFLARVKYRIHSEHGWDVHDPDGLNRKIRFYRRAVHPFVHHYIALSRDLEQYLVQRIGIPSRYVTRICNGVDINTFYPKEKEKHDQTGPPFVIGSVTRFNDIKDPLNTARAFILLKKRLPADADVRFIMVGDGPLLEQTQGLLEDAQLMDDACFPGASSDLPELYRSMDLFVLGSRREGISNTILEAMATGLPVVACRVGGNPELVEEGVTGTLVPPEDPKSLADAMAAYVSCSELVSSHGKAGETACATHSLDEMVRRYTELYLEER